ncbi:alkaline phosphatase family protein [Photorhabdus temperata]|uniref:Phosphoesterase n=1 Tax=Photorhabdus temperata J3 TaxID=1389415 RepID=U7QV65_PHOTE|nr:alkaline phosphatase family protein [Photorhabdus temperata]ERT11773.1 hypothetical protein O185_17720 [Photorhabdus temperata J3]
MQSDNNKESLARSSDDNFKFILNWNKDTGRITLWNINLVENSIISSSPFISFNWLVGKSSHNIVSIGNYIIVTDYETHEYELFEVKFDPYKMTFLSKIPDKSGIFRNIVEGCNIIPLGNFLLFWTPRTGGYSCYPFDPQGDDVIVRTPVKQQKTLCKTWVDHIIIPFQNYLLSIPKDLSKNELWIFDPSLEWNLAGKKASSNTRLSFINSESKKINIGDYLIDIGKDNKINVWKINPAYINGNGEPFFNNISAINSNNGDINLLDVFNDNSINIGFSPMMPMSLLNSDLSPGTIGFMRNKIRKIVYVMFENRSLDHACGWLYEKNAPSVIIGDNRNKKFDGCDSDNNFNIDKNASVIYQGKYKDGKKAPLIVPGYDPHHDHQSVMKQIFGETHTDLYKEKKKPSMAGFVQENGNGETMLAYTPNQLNILNGLAENYAISDKWFCSLPGPTDVNRAFSLTGSSFGAVENFVSGSIYINWPNSPHRSSIWDTLWSNGITDWKIYNYSLWPDFYYTYHLFLKSHIETVDKNKDDYVQGMSKFFADAKSGNLPSFSFIEPAWLDCDNGIMSNSYHPVQDLVHGEHALNDIYNALIEGPDWENTLLVITFDEHGGIYDHVSPPYLNNPYIGDTYPGFNFDLLGVRVPTILVSPWIEKNTLFRPTKPLHYESTSFIATLLKWYGIQKENWWLGERIMNVDTFEDVFTLEKPRKDKPIFKPSQPKEDTPASKMEISDLHLTFLPRIIYHLAQGKLSDDILDKEIDEIIKKSRNLEDMINNITEFQKKMM